MRKGVYPYSYIDSFERLNESQLTKKESFFHELTEYNYSEKEYNHAVHV